MGTAFSSSLLGLAGSLVLGFLELQASHAHNRFYNELEEWLSGITELTPAGVASASSDYVNRQLLGAVVDMQRALEDFSNRLSEQPVAPPTSLTQSGVPQQSPDEVRELARGVNQLVTQMRSEQKVVREWVDEQAQQQAEVANMLRSLTDAMKRGVKIMARGRTRRSNEYGEFWPAYVDVLSTLLLVVTLLMSIFMIAQYFAAQEVSGKDSALKRLTRRSAS